jgi:hypothetical protein
VRKSARMLCVVGMTMAVSASSALAWDDFDNLARGLQTPWQGWQWPWQGQMQLQLPSWQGQWPLGDQTFIKGNDTGGILVWSPENERNSRQITDAFCQGFNKYARITGVHRQYGDYISFNCLWSPSIARYAMPEVHVRAPR